LGAQHDKGTGVIQGLHVAETLLSALKVPFTFLRAGGFVENVSPSLEAVRAGQLPSFLPADFAYSQVGTHDIGLLASELLLEHPKAHRVVEFTGPVDVSANDVARTFGKLLGTEVKAVAYPVKGTAGALEGLGFSAELAGLYQEMMEGLLSGHVAFEHPERVRRGKETLEQTLSSLLKAT
jgi:uncharacterized protein YbjT (DUF2867 family)